MQVYIDVRFKNQSSIQTRMEIINKAKDISMKYRGMILTPTLLQNLRRDLSVYFQDIEITVNENKANVIVTYLEREHNWISDYKTSRENLSSILERLSSKIDFLEKKRFYNYR